MLASIRELTSIKFEKQNSPTSRPSWHMVNPISSYRCGISWVKCLL